MITTIILAIITLFVIVSYIAYNYAIKKTSVEPIPAPPSYSRYHGRGGGGGSYSGKPYSTNDINSNNSSSDD